MTTTKPRWVWIPVDGGRVLAFVYDDRMAGPSAKGAAVGKPPTDEEVRRAVDHPDRTFRQPSNFRAVPLRAEEVLRLGLPRTPPWIGHFDGSPVPPPRGEPSRVVTGTVTRDGVPVAGARVRLGVAPGRFRELLKLDQRSSDAAGRFEFPLAPVKEVVVIADVAGASSPLVDVPADTDTVELTLRTCGVITGEVRRADLPVEAQISIRGLDGGVHRVVMTRPAGLYRIDDVVPGTYEVEAAALDGYRPNGPPVLTRVTVDEGRTCTRDFTLAVGVVLEVVVHIERDDDRASIYLVTGALAPRMSSELRALSFSPALRSANSMQIADRRITTRFCDVTPGEYTLCVTPSGHHAASDQPAAHVRLVVEHEPQAVEITLPALLR